MEQDVRFFQAIVSWLQNNVPLLGGMFGVLQEGARQMDEQLAGPITRFTTEIMNQILNVFNDLINGANNRALEALTPSATTFSSAELLGVPAADIAIAVTEGITKTTDGMSGSLTAVAGMFAGENRQLRFAYSAAKNIYEETYGTAYDHFKRQGYSDTEAQNRAQQVATSVSGITATVSGSRTEPEFNFESFSAVQTRARSEEGLSGYLGRVAGGSELTFGAPEGADRVREEDARRQERVEAITTELGREGDRDFERLSAADKAVIERLAARGVIEMDDAEALRELDADELEDFVAAVREREGTMTAVDIDPAENKVAITTPDGGDSVTRTIDIG